MGLLPGTDQEYLFRGPAESGKGGGVLPRHVDKDRHLELVPWGYFGERAAEDRWLAGKAQGWTESVKTLSGVHHKHTQSAYTGLQKSLQQEWEFVQLVTPGIGESFGLVEQALQEALILEIF